MNIVALEIGHDRYAIEEREKWVFNDAHLNCHLSNITSYVEEAFIFSTCNRWAVYAYAESIDSLVEVFDQFPDIKNQAVRYSTTEESVRHLFATAAGLNSQVIGEHEVLGQLKEAINNARKFQCIGSVLDECLREALRVGKLVRSQTGIGKYTTSIAVVATQLIEHYHSLGDKNILIVGTGKQTQNVLKLLKKKKINRVYVASHDMHSAEELADKYEFMPILINQIESIFGAIDVVIGGGRESVSSSDLMEMEVGLKNSLSVEDGRSRLFIDLGMPRNFHPQIKDTNGVIMFDLDDIKSRTVGGMKKRLELLPDAWEIIDEESEYYEIRLNNRKYSEIYATYWKTLQNHKSHGLQWLKPKLGDVNDGQWLLIERWAHKMIRSISSVQFYNMRDMIGKEKIGKDEIDLIKDLFGIEEVCEKSSLIKRSGQILLNAELTNRQN